MDGHSHHDHQKRDLQVSRKGVVDSCKGVENGQRGKGKGGSAKRAVHVKVLACTYIYIVSRVYLQLMNIVFRL